MDTLTRILATLSLLAISLHSSASILWDVTFTGLAYNTSTGALGNEVVRYRYNPEDLTLTTMCCGLAGPAYTLSGSVLSYTYEGIASGAGGSASLWADNPDLFHNSVQFAGTTASDLSASGQILRTPFWADPYEVSGGGSWYIPNSEGRVPLVGGEGEFVWIQDISHYQSLTGLLAPDGGLTFQFSVSRLPEPGSLVLLATVLTSLLVASSRRTLRGRLLPSPGASHSDALRSFNRLLNFLSRRTFLQRNRPNPHSRQFILGGYKRGRRPLFQHPANG